MGSYKELDDGVLISLLTTHRRNIAHLEQQAAGFGSLHVPLHIQNQLHDEHAAIVSINRELQQRGRISAHKDEQYPHIGLPETKTSNVFLSYSSHDKAIVWRLAKDLKDAGIHVWLDQWEIKVGDPITQKIQEGLKTCDYLAVWLTFSSVSSQWVQREWGAKYHEEISNGKVIILPLLAESCELPPLLRDKRYADFRCDYQSGLKELLEVFNVHTTDGLPQDTQISRSSGIGSKVDASMRFTKEQNEIHTLKSLMVEYLRQRTRCSAHVLNYIFEETQGYELRLCNLALQELLDEGLVKSDGPLKSDESNILEVIA